MTADRDLVDLFAEQLELCNVSAGETIALLTDPGTRGTHLGSYPEAITAAGHRLGAEVFEVALRRRSSRGAAETAAEAVGHTPLADLPAAVTALKEADMVVDLFLLLHSPEQLDILATGTRILLVLEPPEVLERMFANRELKFEVLEAAEQLGSARTMSIRSDAGTDLRFELGEFDRLTVEYGYVDEPGRWDHMTSGMVATYANEGSAQGMAVLDRGDVLFPFKRYVETPVRLTVSDGYITAIDGGFDALLMREYMDGWDDEEAFAFSHIGWGLNSRAKWTSIATGDSKALLGMDQRCFRGNVMISTGPNVDGGGQRHTPCHLDLPMRGCSLWLDDELVVDRGRLARDGSSAR